MKLQELVNELKLEVIVGDDQLNKEVIGGYCSDLLSFVMSNCNKNNIWVTLQSHPNIVALASLIGLSAVLIAEGGEVEEETINKAKREETIIIRTDQNCYQIVGKLYQLGINSEE
ncbi:DRTGG domain-containing protein [Natranaerobius trueperi]|uniref:Serine kinase n=1 Tax=Natranaerobius trueperi TaxID=759412 RepID=A0A226BW97_9FIRM|nr:DRTGG domain-containing protein [Natranaerobius trueperi]OWZ83273.1 serine kinase [Natranaerobius trueperi]